MSAIKYFEILLLISLWCCGFYAITRERKVFDFISRWAYKLPEKVKDPIVACITCMGSVHSLLVYGFISWQHIFGITYFDWRIWILLAIPTAFLNELFWNARTSLLKYSSKPN